MEDPFSFTFIPFSKSRTYIYCEKIMTKFFPLISSYLFFQNDKDSPPVPQLLEDDTPPVGDEGDGKQKKSRGKRARTEDSSLDEKRLKFLERNRAAATRCREKKKHWMQELQQKANTLFVANSQMQVHIR